MRVFYCDTFVLPLPEGHRFPMEKYRLLRERVGEELDGRIRLQVPDGATDLELERAHTPEWVRAVRTGRLSGDGVRRIGFPWSPELVERSRRSVGGTIGAARAALAEGVGVNLAGGTHHAFGDRGGGFCVFNDAAVALRALQAEGSVRRAAVLDLDVHQGDGTASIFQGDDSVFTLSVHGAGNYPFRKEESDLDLALEDGTGDEEYLDCVRFGVGNALALSGADLAVYVAGADPLATDRLGRLSVTAEGLAERDRIVLDACAQAGVPVAVVMAGGYARDVRDTVTVHANTVREAWRAWSS